MEKPLVISIPHQLGKDEALRRLKGRLERGIEAAGAVLTVNEQRWDGDRFSFRVTAMNQQASGTVDVADDYVRVEVLLPWLLAQLASGLKDAIAKRGALLLEKK
jgi:hypothetical protein